MGRQGDRDADTVEQLDPEAVAALRERRLPRVRAGRKPKEALDFTDDGIRVRDRAYAGLVLDPLRWLDRQLRARCMGCLSVATPCGRDRQSRRIVFRCERCRRRFYSAA